MFFCTPYHYTYSTGGFGITLNALGTDSVGRNYTQCFTVSGSKFYVYVDNEEEDIHIYHQKYYGQIEGESDAAMANRYAAAYDLVCYPTHFTTDARLYVYAAIPRSEEADQVAVIVYPPQRIDILGRVEEVNENGEKVERQLGDPDFYYIDLQGRITSASDGPREWEFEIVQGAILGYIVGDEAGGTRAEGNEYEQMIKELVKKIEGMNFFEEHVLGVTKAYEVDPETGDFRLDENGDKIPVKQQAKDDDGNLLYKDADGHTTTEVEGNEPLMIEVSIERKSVKLKDKYEGLWAQGWISALGINPRTLAGGSGYCDLEIIWDEDYEEWMDGAAIEGDDILDGSGIGGGSGVSYLSKLKDVMLTSPQEGDILVYTNTGNGPMWVNRNGIDKTWFLNELSKYVTLATPQIITAKKTFTDGIVLKSGDVEIELSIDAEHRAIKIGGAAYSTSWLSALGINSDATQSFMSESRVNELIDAYVSSHELGKTYTFGVDGTGNALASFTQSGTEITFTRKSFVETANFTKENIEKLLGKKYWANVEISDTSSNETEPTFARVHIGGGTIEWDADNQAFRFLQAAYSESWMSALGINDGALPAGITEERVNEMINAALDSFKPGDDGLAEYTFSISGDGNAITGFTQSGRSITFTKGTFLTEHQSLEGLVTDEVLSTTVENVLAELTKYVTIAEKETITGEKTFSAVADFAADEGLIYSKISHLDDNEQDSVGGYRPLWYASRDGSDVNYKTPAVHDSLVYNPKTATLRVYNELDGEENPVRGALEIGGGRIEWDDEHKAFRFCQPVYSDSWISALGLNDGALPAGITEDQVNFLIGQAMSEWADEFKIDVSTDDAAATGNAITGYEWDADKRQLKFKYGTISGGSSSGGDSNLSWGDSDKEETYVKLTLGGVTKILLLENAINYYKPQVDWSKVPDSLNTKAAKAGRADVADTADKLTNSVSLWGNSFDGSKDINKSIVLADKEDIYFGDEDKGRHISFLSTPANGDRFWLSHGLQIGEGIIQWDDANKALKFSSAIYSESWISALGANSATIDEVVINNKLSVGGLTTTKELTVGLDDYAGAITLRASAKNAPSCSIEVFNTTSMMLKSVANITFDASEVSVKSALTVGTSIKMGEKTMTTEKWEKFVDWVDENII